MLHSLPKTIDSSGVLAIVRLLDRSAIDAKVAHIERTYANYKQRLDAHLGVVRDLIEPCERFALANQQLERHMAQIDFELFDSSAASLSPSQSPDLPKQHQQQQMQQRAFGDQERLVVELDKQLCDECEPVWTRLAGPLASDIEQAAAQTDRIAPERVAPLKRDLDASVEQSRCALHSLGERVASMRAELGERQATAARFYAQVDELFASLDDIEARIARCEACGISYEPDVIRAQLAETTLVGQELHAVCVERMSGVGGLCEQSKQLVRCGQLDDSLELKEKLASLHSQAQGMQASVETRCGQLEQALAVANTFWDGLRALNAWFDDDVGKRVESAMHARQRRNNNTNSANAVSNSNGTNEDATTTTKDAIKSELTVLKQVERDLVERKADLEAMSKNGQALVKLCNASARHMWHRASTTQLFTPTIAAAAGSLLMQRGNFRCFNNNNNNLKYFFLEKLELNHQK